MVHVEQAADTDNYSAVEKKAWNPCDAEDIKQDIDELPVPFFLPLRSAYENPDHE